MNEKKMEKTEEKIIEKFYRQQEILSEISLELNSLDDFDNRINNVLSKIGKHVDVSRVYIFEDRPDGRSTDNTFEWCNSEVVPQMDELQDIPYSMIPNWKKILMENGRVYSENIAELPKDIRAILEPQEILSIIVYPLFKNGKFFGFIGFDECTNFRKWPKSDLELLRTISGIIANTFRRRDIEEELKREKEVAERASMIKAQFLSTMSHEIRTPMNAVIGMTYLLMQENPKPEQLHNLKILKFSAQNLLGIINDILDFSKIEAGKINLEEEDVFLRDLVDGIIYSFTAKTREKGIYIKAHMDDDLPEVILGDQIRITQILNNLVSNAVKFTEKGGVDLYIELINKKDQQVELEFSVRDTGIGIPKSFHESIFEEFTQADLNTTRLYGGTGLGLAITNKLLKLYNSKVHLESEPGKGSEFSFRIITSAVNRKQEKKERIEEEISENALAGVRILVVEDNKVNQMVARKFLEKWNTKPDFAEHGGIAMKMLEQNTYDLVLMDLQMPEMDGYETTRAIRGSEASHSGIPIIALSASAMLQIRQKALDSGMNDFVIKPFKPAELFNKILRLVKLS